MIFTKRPFNMAPQVERYLAPEEAVLCFLLPGTTRSKVIEALKKFGAGETI